MKWVSNFILFILFYFSNSVIYAFYNKPLQLSLKEAILLAIRENPNVQQAQLNHISQKFNLHVQQWAFQPQYAFNASINRTVTKSNGIRQFSKQASIEPSVTLLSPIGTQLTFNAINNFTSNYNPALSLQIVQPLMRGFGSPVVEAALHNAIDSEYISRLNVENILRTTITAVINAYLDVVSAENTVLNDEKAVERAQLSVKQTQLFIKAGHKAGNEIITVQADLANAQTTLQNDKNTLQQSQYALLTAIGIDPNTPVKFTSLDIQELIKKYHVPTMIDAQKKTLLNDIQYQVDQITYEGSIKRSLMIAEDSARWQLNLTLNGALGQGSGGSVNAGLGSISNGYNNSKSAQLSLQIPIDNQSLKQAILDAKIALQQAKIGLTQEKWAKQTSAINGWNTIQSAEQALRFADNAAKLQHETYNISYKKYLYGLIDSTILQSVQQQLITTDQGLVSARINYLKSLVSLDLITGNTLLTWDVRVRFS